MKLKPKVTVGLCVKNVEITVKEAIDSVFSQDFPHELMELIVIDGYSQDKTLSIIKENLVKADIRNKVFSENKGLGWARQIVVDNAGGDYIVWVDGDMVLPRDYVRKQVEFMERNPKVGIAGGKYGVCLGQSLVAALENIVYVVDSEYGEKATSNLGHLPGTEGSIYRVRAIRQVGGFDGHIKGATEDTEAAYKVKAAGWLLHINKEVFRETCRETWKDLWNQYFWYGYGGHYLLHKHSGLVDIYKMLPPAGFIAGLLRSFSAYKLMRRKVAFLLPIHYTFKRIAFCFGFVKGHKDGYGHTK